MPSKREAERKRYVRSRAGRWNGPKVHESWCQYAQDKGYTPISALEVAADDVLCKVCQPNPSYHIPESLKRPADAR